MKSLILDGSFTDDRSMDGIIDAFSVALKQIGWDVEVVKLSDKKIAGCLACDACWYKTPGVCAINDEGRDVACKIIRGDLTVFMSPVMFGGYSSVLKKTIDRTKPLLAPTMSARGGVLGHAQRYGKYPKIVSVGQLPGPDAESEKLFEALLRRNSLNYTSPAVATGIIYNGQDMEKTNQLIVTLLKKVGIQ